MTALQPTDFPEDIHFASNAVIEQEFDAGYFNPNLWEAIARAILAERERCVEIIQPLTVQGGVGGTHIRKAAWGVLDAIRTPLSARGSTSNAEQAERQA